MSNLQIAERPIESNYFKTPLVFFQYNFNLARLLQLAKALINFFFWFRTFPQSSAAPFFSRNFACFTTKPQYQYIAPIASPFQIRQRNILFKMTLRAVDDIFRLRILANH